MSIRCPVLVGRAAQTGRFTRAVTTVLTGQGGTSVLLAGEPGIGKSRLAREFAAGAAEAGFLCLTGRCVPTGAPVPLRPFVEALLALSREDRMPDRAAMGSYGAALGRVLPEWTTAQGHDRAFSPPVLGEALLRLLRLVAPAGCLLVLEDLHWADPESLAVVEYLCDHAAETALIVVGTLRTGANDATWAMVGAVAVRGSAELVALGPLDHDDVQRMVERCGRPDLGAAVVERASGVPLLVEEMLDRHVASCRIAPIPSAVTPRERQVLELLRSGLSNRELAHRLMISPRTVEKHVEALTRKLGVGGRGPLIAIAAREHRAGDRDLTLVPSPRRPPDAAADIAPRVPA